MVKQKQEGKRRKEEINPGSYLYTIIQLFWRSELSQF